MKRREEGRIPLANVVEAIILSRACCHSSVEPRYDRSLPRSKFARKRRILKKSSTERFPTKGNQQITEDKAIRPLPESLRERYVSEQTEKATILPAEIQRLVLHYGTGVTSLPSRGRYSWYVSLSARVTNAPVPIFRVRNKLLASSQPICEIG